MCSFIYLTISSFPSISGCLRKISSLSCSSFRLLPSISGYLLKKQKNLQVIHHLLPSISGYLLCRVSILLRYDFLYCPLYRAIYISDNPTTENSLAQSLYCPLYRAIYKNAGLALVTVPFLYCPLYRAIYDPYNYKIEAGHVLLPSISGYLQDFYTSIFR